MNDRSFLSSWFGLYRWALYLRDQLIGLQWQRAYTHQKQRLDLIFSSSSQSMGLTWTRQGNGALLTTHSGTGIPRRHVSVFKGSCHAQQVTDVEIAQCDRLIRIRLDDDSALVLGFYPELLNAYCLQGVRIREAFLKEPKPAMLTVPFTADPDTDRIAAEQARTGLEGDPRQSFHYDSGRIRFAKDGVDMAGLTRQILAAGPRRPAPDTVNWLKQGRTVAKRWRRKLNTLEEEYTRSERWPEWEQTARALVIAQSMGLTPKDGQVSLEPAASPTGEQMVVDIADDSPLGEKAETLFKRVRKAKARLESLAELLPRNRELLQKLEAFLEQANANVVEQFLKDHGETDPGTRGQPAERRPYQLHQAPSGTDILVGRSARDNDTLTFKIAGKQDWWFHARGVSGSHVILKSDRDPVDHSDLMAAAELAARHSNAKHAGIVVVQYCQRKHLSKSKGAPPGVVRVHREQTVTIELSD